MAENTPATNSWLVPALISAVVGFVTILGTVIVNNSAQDTQMTLEASKLKASIITSINIYDTATSKILLKHSLKPLEKPESFNAFVADYNSLLAQRLPEAPIGAKEFGIVSEEVQLTQGLSAAVVEAVTMAVEENVTGIDTGVDQENAKIQIGELVNSFTTDDRLIASDAVVELYKIHPILIVDSLINNLLPDSDSWSYRNNLYVVFTLSRISEGWEGTDKQLQAVKDLSTSNNFSDPTFSRRVNEAIKSFREI